MKKSLLMFVAVVMVMFVSSCRNQEAAAVEETPAVEEAPVEEAPVEEVAPATEEAPATETPAEEAK
jgi:flagellar basal body L-ring protein FlgH